MKTILSIALIAFASSFMFSCKSSKSAPKNFCDSTCLSDTLKFIGDHPLKPYVYIKARDCRPDSIIRGYKGMGRSLKIGFDYKDISFNKNYARCVFRDTASVYFLFNDCITGRGYQLLLPFNTTGNVSKRSSGINNLDPKFNVADNMIAYTDRGNIYVEEAATGKQAMMTFGQATDMDYDAIHETLDSVNVTPSRIWVRVKLNGKWTELEKKITLN